MVASRLTLAVAGSGKTRSIVDQCLARPAGERVLVLTYTRNNQNELSARFDREAGDDHNIVVSGWFSFLLGCFVRPFLPYVYPGRRLRGFDFKSEHQRGKSVDRYDRYFNAAGQARKAHLPQLAVRINEASGGAPLRNIARLYDHIYIDEVQDLCGYDLEILRLLIDCGIRLTMIGDVRQAVIATNVQEPKHGKYKFMGIWDWFREQEKAGRIEIHQSRETWRCRPEVALFADGLFSSEFGFEATISKNPIVSGHDGVFLVREGDLAAYILEYSPLVLRQSANSARGKDFDFMNFKASKGLAAEHVLIWPTANIRNLISSGRALERQAAAELYVAVTRARQSVALVIDQPGTSAIPFWLTPRTPSSGDAEGNSTE
jgi:superfamily I DNA/RNA helicase